MSMAVFGSVAAALLCLGGFGAVVYGAGPGDALYGLRIALFGEQQLTRTDQVALASQQLAEVQQLINEGQWDAAQAKLQTLTTTVATVNDVEQKQELVTQWQDLTVKVDAKDPNATLPPGVPPPVMPEPAVVAPGSTTSTNHVVGDEQPTTTSSSETTHRRRRPGVPPEDSSSTTHDLADATAGASDRRWSRRRSSTSRRRPRRSPTPAEPTTRTGGTARPRTGGPKPLPVPSRT